MRAYAEKSSSPDSLLEDLCFTIWILRTQIGGAYNALPGKCMLQYPISASAYDRC